MGRARQRAGAPAGPGRAYVAAPGPPSVLLPGRFSPRRARLAQNGPGKPSCPGPAVSERAGRCAADGPGQDGLPGRFLLAGPASLLDLLIWALRPGPGSGKPGPAKAKARGPGPGGASRARQGARAGPGTGPSRARQGPEPGPAGPGAPLCKSTRFPSNISHSAAEAPTESGARGRGSLLVVPTPRTTPGDSRGPRSSKPAPLTSGASRKEFKQDNSLSQHTGSTQVRTGAC